jgi:flagellar transcriptional activator FlhD
MDALCQPTAIEKPNSPAGVTAHLLFKLAAAGQLMCLFRFNDHATLRALTQSAKHADVAPTHAAILLAGPPAEQLA